MCAFFLVNSAQEAAAPREAGAFETFKTLTSIRSPLEYLLNSSGDSHSD